ncbi:Heterogeneous nuclear ribonucleoprotein Q [Vitis vinifera]|uniref:Heterogeneous nuclear ribonucleoprotein Q n=1 Tax=Vitis vinifera TaxID=29760 RepID=A0A438I0W1_VITVI|nr:Heterogeneous nuclear ribonucleoprotein Q [Vitis vinifera]
MKGSQLDHHYFKITTLFYLFIKPKICGKQCGTAPVEGNDTIFLGNIDKNWKNEDVVKLLQEIGIDKIDKVTVMVDPSNIERNRGFAFLELETNKDAQLAYKKLQKKDIFGKHQNIKVAWAEPLNEPDEDEMLKVKTVYAEYIPSSWEEEKVRDCFKKFGEIESVVLARNLRSSKRKDFAFVKYTTREAALECIESFNREPLHDAECKVKVKVSLAKPIPKGKQIKRVSDPLSKDISNQKPKATKRDIKPNNPRNKGKSIGNTYEEKNVVGRSSTNAELVQLLREQASWRQPQRGLGGGSLLSIFGSSCTGALTIGRNSISRSTSQGTSFASVNLEYPYSLPGSKRPYAALGDDPLYSDLRVRPRTHLESSFPVASPGYTAISQGAGMTSLSYHERQGPRYTSGYAYLDLPTGFQCLECSSEFVSASKGMYASSTTQRLFKEPLGAFGNDVWDGGSWGSRFIRQFNDWELEEVDALFGRLHSYSIGSGTFDTMVWLETKDGDFSIWSFYSSLASRRVEPFLYDSVEFLGPFRASFFAWEATWAKILTHDQLRGRVGRCQIEEGGWCTRAVSGRHGVGFWKAIRKEWLGMNSSLAYCVGCGRRVRFWKDKWCGDAPLCESFPSLFSISLAKNTWVLDVWNPDGVRDGWTPLFSRAFNDWEIEMVERFMLKIQAFRVQREDEDKVVWTASKSGAFSVKSLYSILEPGGSSLFPCGNI